MKHKVRSRRKLSDFVCKNIWNEPRRSKAICQQRRMRRCLSKIVETERIRMMTLMRRMCKPRNYKYDLIIFTVCDYLDLDTEKWSLCIDAKIEKISIFARKTYNCGVILCEDGLRTFSGTCF